MLKIFHSCWGSIGKSFWGISRQIGFIYRWTFYFIFSGSYFKSIGWGTRVFGKLRFGSADGNISIGRDCMLGHGLFFSATQSSQVAIGDRCTLNTGCHIVAVAGITIGNDTLIAEYCSIRDQNHIFDNPSVPIAQQGFEALPITIGKGVWIGRGVFIGAGVSIGDGAVIGANSVVVKDIEANAVAVGVPAKVIRYIQ